MRLRLYHHHDGARVAYREAGAGPGIALLHSLSVDYTRNLVVSGGTTIVHSGNAAQVYEVAGLASSELWVVDARFSDRAALVPYETRGQAGGTYAVRFTAQPGGTGKFLVVPVGLEGLQMARMRGLEPRRMFAVIMLAVAGVAPFFLILFLAPVYVPLSLLSGWIHAVASVNPVTALLEAGRGFISGAPTEVVLAFAAALGLTALFALWAVRGLRLAESAG